MGSSFVHLLMKIIMGTESQNQNFLQNKKQ